MTDCPCCSRLMLRHITHNTTYWFCPHCRQKMPDLSTVVLEGKNEIMPRRLPQLNPLSASFSEVVLAANP